MSVVRFYDDLAAHYHLIFSDWEESMRRQGDVLGGLIRAHFPNREPADIHILDAAAGIGTQALPLRALGFSVVARDVSPAALARLDREAGKRGLDIPTDVADMRTVHESVERPFDVVLALDNAVPHLEDDTAILAAFESLRRAVDPRGVILISVRDYDQVDRRPVSSHPYGERRIGGRTLRFRQDWRWIDRTHYETTMIGEERIDDRWTEMLRTTARYYAVSLSRLEALLIQAQLAPQRSDEFYQPLFVARRTPKNETPLK